jgi:hypothetical protein
MEQLMPDTSFDFSGGIGDIGGDDIDLRSLDMTDTLIGSAMNELTAALGEVEENPYEAYHQGDGGISDIVLTTFDSALLLDGGIRPYTEDSETQNAIDNASEMAEIMGKPLAKVEEDHSGDIADILANLDSVTKREIYLDYNPWLDAKVLTVNEASGEVEFVDDENEFTDADFDDSATFFEEYGALHAEALEGKWDHILKRKTLSTISKEPNIRLVPN